MDQGSADPGTVITDLDDLLAATGCADLDDLTDLVNDDLDVDLALFDDSELLFVGYDGSGTGLAYPFALGQFWTHIEDGERYADAVNAAASLPEPDDEPTSDEVVAAFADFFGVDARDVAFHLGPDWVPIDGGDMTGENEVPQRWFGSRYPVQVLLGIGAEYATVAHPDPVPAGLAGPARMEHAGATDVVLRAPATLSALAAAVRDTADARRETFTYCPICRRLHGPELASVGTDESSREWCRDCAATHAGIIVC